MKYRYGKFLCCIDLMWGYIDYDGCFHDLFYMESKKQLVAFRMFSENLIEMGFVNTHKKGKYGIPLLDQIIYDINKKCIIYENLAHVDDDVWIKSLSSDFCVISHKNNPNNYKNEVYDIKEWSLKFVFEGKTPFLIE